MAAVNPKVISDTDLPKRYLLVADSQTWVKGTFCLLSSGTVTPLTNSGSTAVYGIFAEDQATATSTTSVWVYVLVEGTLLDMYVSNGTASTVSVANLGTAYGAETVGSAGSEYCSLDLGTASGQFRVERLMPDVEPHKGSTSHCICKFLGYVS